MRATADATAHNGFGAVVGTMRCSASGWSAYATLLAATYSKSRGERPIDTNLGVARIGGRDDAVGGLEDLGRRAGGSAKNEGYGLSTPLNARRCRNTDPYRPQYDSPQSLNEPSLRLSARWRASEQVVLSAWADGGMQYAKGNQQPIWSASFGRASPCDDPIRWNWAFWRPIPHRRSARSRRPTTT
jgi:hypothetical protein